MKSSRAEGHGRPPRLFVEALPAVGDACELSTDAGRHLRVLRLQPPAEVELFDGRGGVAGGELLPQGRVRCVQRREVPAASPSLTLLLGLPKGQKLDGIVRMLTELGVDAIRLAYTERSVPTPGSFDSRMQRLVRIAREACGQSQQPRVPHISAPMPLPALAAERPDDATGVCFWERAETPLSAALGSASSAVWAAVGPEGGFSDAEAQALSELGYAHVGLGPGILRVETAAVVCAGLLLHGCGRLGG